MHTHIFLTRFGWVNTAWTEGGLAALILPKENRKEAVAELEQKLAKYKYINKKSGPQETLSHLPVLLESILTDYFHGISVAFNLLVDLSWCTPFQQRVLKAVQQIPYSKTYSYGQVAITAGYPGAARAVGRTAGANRTPIIIPCHRVIKQNGESGGFSGNIEIKKRLLALEAANIYCT